MSISHAIYLVSDTRQAVDFLSHLFGMRVLADETAITGERFLSMGTDDAQAVRLQIVEVDFVEALVAHKKPHGIVDFIFETADMAALMAKVEQAGLTVQRPPIQAEYGLTAIVVDPFGNLWDLVQR